MEEEKEYVPPGGPEISSAVLIDRGMYKGACTDNTWTFSLFYKVLFLTDPCSDKKRFYCLILYVSSHEV